jgi:cobalt-zinc-cadmium efflux system membrane fusion protein
MRSAILVAIVALAGCDRHVSPKATAQRPPEGEAWMTDAELAIAQIRVEPIKPHEVEDDVFATGKLTFSDELVSHVYSPVTGRVTRIDGKLGQRVKKGDVLAVIQSPDIGQFSSDLDKASAELIAADHNVKRQRELFASQAASAADVEQAEDNYSKAKAEKERALEKSRLLRAGNVDTVTQTYTLTSPLDGETIARFVNPGVEVQGQYSGGTAVELFTIGEIDKLWVMVDVFELDLPSIKEGTPAIVTVPSFPDRKFNATVDFISGAIDPASRAVKVRCVLDNADRALRPEMYATVQLDLDRRTVPAIPRKAVFRIKDDLYVFLEAGAAPTGARRFVRTKVHIDERYASGDWVPAPTPLVTGNSVVTNNAIMMLGML